MPVSFYALVGITIASLLLTLVPFLGFPHPWERALVAIFGSLIFGTSLFSLYRGYVRILSRMEKNRNKD